MEVELQLAALSMSTVATPTALALEVAAPRAECAEKASVLIPAFFITLFSQCPIVTALTGRWGLRTAIKSGLYQDIDPLGDASTMTRKLCPRKGPVKSKCNLDHGLLGHSHGCNCARR